MAGEGATHYNWRPDVRRRVAEILYRWPVSINTYRDHPTGWGLDTVSLDVWSPNGRGSILPAGIGSSVLGYVFNHPEPPAIAWYIWQGVIWTPSLGERPYTDPTDLHYNHLHVTYL